MADAGTQTQCRSAACTRHLCVKSMGENTHQNKTVSEAGNCVCNFPFATLRLVDPFSILSRKRLFSPKRKPTIMGSFGVHWSFILQTITMFHFFLWFNIYGVGALSRCIFFPLTLLSTSFFSENFSFWRKYTVEFQTNLCNVSVDTRVQVESGCANRENRNVCLHTW